jgi:class 3 adenylate cyclase
MTESVKSLPLPDDPVLSAWASALNDAGYWANMLDAEWRYVFQTDELRRTLADMYGALTASPMLGLHYFSREANERLAETVGGPWAEREFRRAWFLELGPYALASMSGGRDELRRVVNPELADLIEDLQPRDAPDAWIVRPEWTTAGADVAGSAVWFRIDDRHGHLAGFCILSKPGAGMSHLGALAAVADLAHLERMRFVERPGRRPVAILMADLEASSPLARRLSTAQYFAFSRRLVRGADRCIIDAGGIVGRHAGDGVVAFFLADTTGSESAAARACITAARILRDSLAEIATRSGITESELSLRFGLHWGATLYMGRILTAGRSEVTGFGDEVNEAARIEACATGRALASKSLIERLTPDDAEALGLDTAHMTYTPLAELATATDKARRDASSIAVCEV